MVNYECETCNYTTKKKSNFNQHLESKKHINACKKNKPIKEIRIGTYICEHCDKEFREKRYLKQHLHTSFFQGL